MNKMQCLKLAEFGTTHLTALPLPRAILDARVQLLIEHVGIKQDQ